MSKFCENCGAALNENDVFCTKCGTRVKNESNNTNNAINNTAINNESINTSKAIRVSPLAITSLVCSIIGLFILGYIMGFVSISCSSTFLKQQKSNPNLKGKGLAIAGLVIGIIDIVAVSITMVLNSAK